MRFLHRSLLSAAVSLVALTPPAAADVTTSHNWAGYAIHRAGLRFTRVSASWRQPIASCIPGRRTYSAFWVGIGGYSLSSTAVEQIGTELDCTADGDESMSAWYELLPAPTRAIHMTVKGDDLISASVAFSGDRTTLTLRDASDQQGFTTTVLDGDPDATSAEWIAEAPSDCTSASRCSVLALADFRSVRFTRARAVISGGRSGAISSPLWRTTGIRLQRSSGVRALPGPLATGGAAFQINYSDS